MKIAIRAEVHPASAAGGVQTYLGALIKALGELGDGNEEYLLLSPAEHTEWLEKLRGPNQRIVPLVYDRGGIGRRVINRIRRETKRGASAIARTSFFRASGPVHTKKSAMAFRELLPISTGFVEGLGVSVIHFPYQDFFCTGVPSIYTPHDLQHLHLPQFFSPQDTFAREVYYPWACRLATRVAVASEWVKRDVCEKYALPLSKVAVIRLPAATGAFPPPTSEDVAGVRAKYHLPETFVLYPAVTWRHKNHARLIEAMGILKAQGNPVPLVLSGAWNPEEDRLKGLITKLGLTDSVSFLGVVPAEYMRALYKASSGVVVPTLFEAASGPVLEAWLDEIPVACSDIPQLRDQAEGAAIFFSPYSSEDIASKIRMLLDVGPSSERHVHVECGKEKLSTLTWNSSARKYRDLYREVALSAGTRPPEGSH